MAGKGVRRLKRTESFRKNRSVTEPLAAGIVIGAVLLCIVLSYFGYLHNREAVRKAASTAAQAAAQVQNRPESQLEQELDDPFENYIQLSDRCWFW